jgi:serine/threonine protein kinase
VETGRVIHGRYQLQRLVKQTSFCNIYQGMDKRLGRAVAVKAVLHPHVAAYQAAVKVTANFSHPHIIGLYDLVIESDSLYVVQEYVDGEPFEMLVRNRLSPFEIAEIGWQMCLALMYAGSSSRRLCHGDLVPTSVMRDRHGIIRINNFALPDDLTYFQKWSVLGADGVALLETELPWGQQSELRKADDTRAVGLLLYQLLTGSLEPPTDGRLRFSRSVPSELCETIARAIVRQHPQNISAPEVLYAQLKHLASVLEPPVPAPASISYQLEESQVRQYSPAGAAKLTSTLSARESEHSGRNIPSYSGKLRLAEPTPPTVAITSAPFQAGGQPMLAPFAPNPKPAPSAWPILLLGLFAFALFFVVGYFLGHALIH